MLGLFGILNVGTRSMSAQRAGVEVAGQNLANVNNPAYARQRVVLATSLTVTGEIGPQGTGVDAIRVIQIRSALLDQQIQAEGSVRGSLQAQQIALQYAQAALGVQIDRLASGAEGAAAAQGVGGGHTLADSMSELFNAFQSLSTNPTSMAERQTLLMKAVSLASQFNQMDRRFDSLRTSLNNSIQSDAASANELLAEIATLNEQIGRVEAAGAGSANDLRDTRQQRIEALAKYVKLDVTTGSGGALDISIGGVAMVAGTQVTDTLEAYDAGGGQYLVRAMTAGTPLTLTGGSIQGTIDARDGAVASLQSGLNTLASLLISEVNTIHAAGFSLSGVTGQNFFTGGDASDMGVNSALTGDPSLVAAAGAAGASGDNTAALALAQLAQKKLAALNNQTLSQGYGQQVAAFGQALATVNTSLADQEVVENMMLQQRDSISGVSLDEEMADLTKFQKAFAASARLIMTVDEMLETVVNLKR
jgi:flagellar hook-associated protein 1 FlgK